MIIEKIPLNEEIRTFVNTIFENYEKRFDVSYNYTSFSFVAKEEEKIIGVVTGHTCFSEVHISDLVVIEKQRGKKVGSQLIRTVEEYFKQKGFQTITLCTYEFQAPEFYKKLGFQIEFIRKHKENPKINKYYFIKDFDALD